MAEKREINLDLLARDKTSGATRSAAKNLDDVADSATDASKATDRLGKTASVAEHESGKLGKTVDGNAGHIEKLTREIGLAEKELQHLAAAFARTDDAAERIDISRGIRKAETDIRRLGKSKSILDALTPSPGEVAGIGARIGQSIMKGLASVGSAAAANGPALALGAGIAATVGPIVAGALSAAVVGGIGLGGIAGGVALAAKDPVVADAGKRVGKGFLDGLTKEAQRFQGPLLRSLSFLETAGRDATGKIGKMFEGLAPFIEPLTKKLVTAGNALLDSFVTAVGKSGPVMDAVGDSIVLVSKGIGSFIETVAGGGQQTADNLRLIAGAAGDLIAATGHVVNWLGKLGDFLPFASLGLDKLREHYRDTATGSDALGTATDSLVTKMTNAERAANGERDAFALLSKELLAQTDPAFAVINAQNKLREASEKSAEAIKKHGRNSEEARAATRNLATAAIMLEGKVGALGANFDGSLTPALRRTLAAAGLTAGQMDAVERELRAAKKAAEGYAKTYKAQVITDYVRVNKNINYGGNSVTGARAAGGPVTKGMPYLVGEQRPEVFVPDSSGTIVPSVSAFMAGAGRAAAGGMSASTTVIEHRISFAETQNEIGQLFLKAIRTSPGVRASAAKLLGVVA